ncbi:MAG: hypothetical protein QOI21_3287 [Actinomycetota bacterium]|jgi:hypothetical protein|nr:hypothetical protein [Actinomycetota bacterium]
MAQSRRHKPDNLAKCLRSIHRGTGIWQDDLHGSLGPGLRAIWGVADNATATQVREIVLLRLKSLLDTRTDPKLPVIVWTAYNLGAAPGTTGMVARFNGLREAGRAGFSERSCTRPFYKFVEALERSLADEHPPLGDADLLTAAGWLAKNIRPERGRLSINIGEGAALYNAIRALRTPVEEPIRRFLIAPVYGPVTELGTMLPARLGKHGTWLCVFTDEHLLDEYRGAAKTNWRTARKHGREVVLEAADGPVPTGVLVNPSPRRGTGIDASLPLPPELIARVAATL